MHPTPVRSATHNFKDPELTRHGAKGPEKSPAAGESQMTGSTRIGRGGSARSRLPRPPLLRSPVASPPKSVSAREGSRLRSGLPARLEAQGWPTWQQCLLSFQGLLDMTSLSESLARRLT